MTFKQSGINNYPYPVYDPYAHIMYLEKQVISLHMLLNNTVQKVNEVQSHIQKLENDNSFLKEQNNKYYKDINYLKNRLEDQTKKTDEKKVKKSPNKKQSNDNNIDKEITSMVDNILENMFSNEPSNNIKKSNPNGPMSQSFIIDMKTGKVTDKKDQGLAPKIVFGTPNMSKGSPFNPFSMLFGKKKESENINNNETDGDTQNDFSKLEKYSVENITTELNNINDLIELANKYPLSKKKDLHILEKVDGLYEYNGKYYGINLETLSKLKKPLEKLNNMIGLDKIKSQILEMIIYYMQEFEKGTSNMLHTIIEGPPGVGKTELGKIFAEIYSGLGVISSNKFKLVKRTDLIGEYVGHTGRKTQDAIDEAEGGVLFIDEAYSLGGGSEKSDTYSKECIDVLNQNLSENKKKLIVIIAGYKDQLETSFFSYNPGLKRRFPFKYTIEGYTPEEIKSIYIKKLNDIKWKLDDNVDDKYLVSFFTKHKDNFKNFGGDIENFILNSKFVHSKRIFKEHPSKRKKLNITDFENAYERFESNKKTVDNTIPIGMYL
jgi:hypothetical protein